MRRFSFFAATLMFAAMFAVPAIAQTGTAQPGPGKVGLVNTFLFAEDKPGTGITKFKNALGVLNAEFKPLNDELTTMQTRFQALAAEIQKLQNSTAPIDPATIRAKVDEYKLLEINIKRKQEDAKARYDSRYEAVVGPVFADILKAMNDYAKAKGYAVIFDGAKLEESQILMGFDDKYDVTRDFIAYYNTRPPGPAVAATPR